jgi:hypothetical protein
VLPGAAAMILPLVTGFLGIAIGFTIFTPLWTKPELVGFQKEFIGQDGNQPWDGGAWIAYAQPVWMPILFALVTLIGVVAIFRLERSGNAKIARIRSVVSTGVRVTGDVSTADSGTTWVNNMPLVTLTVHYKDAAGTERWVTKRRVFPPTAVPRIGDTYTVWYDPRDAANEKKIVLAPGNVTTAAVEAQVGAPDAPSPAVVQGPDSTTAIQADSTTQPL